LKLLLPPQACLIACLFYMQKEGFFAKTQTLTIRNETEWPETIRAKYNRLVNPKEKLIYNLVKKYINSTGKSSKPYGDGKAAKLILKKIQSLKKWKQLIKKRIIDNKVRLTVMIVIYF